MASRVSFPKPQKHDAKKKYIAPFGYRHHEHLSHISIGIRLGRQLGDMLFVEYRKNHCRRKVSYVSAISECPAPGTCILRAQISSAGKRRRGVSIYGARSKNPMHYAHSMYVR